jgi:hypothetical protein
MMVPCSHKTVLQLRITLLPRLANHGIELGFGVSNGPHTTYPSGDYTSYSVGGELSCSGDDGDYHYCRSNTQNQKASTISQVADGIGPE